MAPLFISKYTNKVDQKGRVSVPAPFRDALGDQAAYGIIVYPSFKYNALEGCTYDWLVNLESRIALLDQFSDEHDVLTSLLGQACRLPLDGEGRIVLPPAMTAPIGVTDQVSFSGIGKSFRLWAPSALEEHEASMRKKFVELKMTVSAAPPGLSPS